MTNDKRLVALPIAIASDMTTVAPAAKVTVYHLKEAIGFVG